MDKKIDVKKEIQKNEQNKQVLNESNAIEVNYESQENLNNNDEN